MSAYNYLLIEGEPMKWPLVKKGQRVLQKSTHRNMPNAVINTKCHHYHYHYPVNPSHYRLVHQPRNWDLGFMKEMVS